MEFNTYVRKPFEVEAVEITTENISELAPLIGQLKQDNGQPYIEVDRKKVPNVYKVKPGYWVTKMGSNVRCYTRKIFEDQFIRSDNHIQELAQAITKGAA